MNCFYHPETTAVGTCNHCGKGACRDCVQDIGGALLCVSCIDVLQEEMEAETQTEEREREESLQGSRSRLRWSWIVGSSCAVLTLFVAAPAELSASVPQGQASSVTLAFGLFLGSLVSGYIFWSMYWGIPAVWSWGRKLISSIGCFIVANPLAWVIILVFLFWVPLMLGAYYGVLGGAIYQYFKYRRNAEVKLTRRKLILSGAFVGLLAVGSAVSVALAPNAVGPRQVFGGGPASADVAHAGSPEFDGYASNIIISNIDKRSGDRPNTRFARIRCTVQNAGDKVLTALQLRAAVLGTNGQLIREKVITPVPNSLDVLGPNQKLNIDVSVEPVPVPAKVKDMTLELYGLKVK